MDRQTDRPTDRQTDQLTDRLTDWQTHRQTNRQTDRWKVWWMNGQIGGWMGNGLMDGQTDGWANWWTNRWTNGWMDGLMDEWNEETLYLHIVAGLLVCIYPYCVVTNAYYLDKNNIQCTNWEWIENCTAWITRSRYAHTSCADSHVKPYLMNETMPQIHHQLLGYIRQKHSNLQHRWCTSITDCIRTVKPVYARIL